MKWFDGITDLKNLRKQYIKLAQKYHPDIGGDEEIMKSINIQYAESQILFDENKKAAEKVRKQREHYHSTKSEYQSEPDYDFTSDFWNSYEETDDKKSDFWNVDFKSAVKNSLDFLIGLFEEINTTDTVKLKTDTHKKGSRYRRGKIRRGAVWRT